MLLSMFQKGDGADGSVVRWIEWFMLCFNEEERLSCHALDIYYPDIQTGVIPCPGLHHLIITLTLILASEKTNPNLTIEVLFIVVARYSNYAKRNKDNLSIDHVTQLTSAGCRAVYEYVKSQIVFDYLDPTNGAIGAVDPFNQPLYLLAHALNERPELFPFEPMYKAFEPVLTNSRYKSLLISVMATRWRQVGYPQPVVVR
jgi:hypothetical protein